MNKFLSAGRYASSNAALLLVLCAVASLPPSARPAYAQAPASAGAGASASTDPAPQPEAEARGEMPGTRAPASADSIDDPSAPAPSPAIRTTPLASTSADALAGSITTQPKPVRVGAEVDATVARIVDRMLGEMSRTEGEPRRLSLAEAVQFAVENNPGIRAQAEVPNIDAWESFGATEAYDPKLRANATASSIRAPSGSALASGRQTFEEEAVRTGVSISKLFRTGTDVDLNWQNQIIDTNSVFYTLNPRYDNRLTLSLRQPLLRNFFASDERTTVLVARSVAEESLAAFEANLSRFVQGVIDSYWGFIQAAAELEVSRRSVALARELVRDAEAKVEVGLLAPVAVKEALADAAAREERSIVAENALVVAGRDLQHQVMLGASGERQPDPVIPVEEHVVMPVELDRVASLRTAVESRAEIRGATYALGRRRLEEKLEKNQRLWRLDLVGHYGLLGLSGDARPITDENGNVTFSPYDGGYGQSWDFLTSGDFDDYAVGLELEIPFGNARGRADHAKAQLEVRRASRDLEQTVSSVALEVERAIADVASAAKRVSASKAARDLAEENLRNQTRRFELGAVTTKDVLDFQEKLAEAQASEVRAITDHARSVTLLRVAEGTLLARFGIELRSPDAPDKPWWYRF